MSPSVQVTDQQRARQAQGRGWMAVILVVFTGLTAVSVLGFIEDSPLGRTFAVMSSTLAVATLAELSLYAVNRRLARTGRDPAMAGPADMVLVVSLVLPLVAVGLVALLARPVELVQMTLLFATLWPCALLFAVALATRVAARRS